MIDIDVNSIPKTTNFCVRNDCPMAGECLRFQAAEALMASDNMFLRILNLRMLDGCKEGQCKYFKSIEKQLCGKGILKFLGNLTVDESKTAVAALKKACSSERQYYRYRSGELPITPEMEKVMNRALKTHGIDKEIEFDAMENIYAF